ncbi:MAG: ABC transporter ATP-binding protein [Gemmatimonadetes bacterium]|nr:ABC transporter ATP-binding protein [Gemmatimonadota bacterium]
MTAVLAARALGKVYADGGGPPVRVLAGLDFEVAAGEFVAIVGASGAGKSTLLHLLGGLDRPTEGAVELAGRDLAPLTDTKVAAVRNRHVGFVFQFHHLLRDFTALENVTLPMLIGGTPEPAAEARARAVLDTLGLGARVDHFPAQLSGGERQRVAVARAVAREPVAVLADEPSGNLDPPNAELLHRVLSELRATFQTAVVVATHNRDLAARADRVLRLERGHLVQEAGGDPGRLDG